MPPPRRALPALGLALGLALAACGDSRTSRALDTGGEVLLVDPQSIVSIPGTETALVARLIGWNGPTSRIRWQSTDRSLVVVVDSLVALGEPARVRVVARGPAVLVGTLQRPGPHSITVPVTVPGR